MIVSAYRRPWSHTTRRPVKKIFDIKFRFPFGTNILKHNVSSFKVYFFYLKYMEGRYFFFGKNDPSYIDISSPKLY